jgi:NADP-dependent 3-hydroxy acid dehydrogenase YdfG
MKSVMCITGGAGCLGRGIAACFSRKYQVILLDMDEKILSITGEKLDCDFQVCDVTDPDSVNEAISYIHKKYHQIDCLINAAGIYIDGEIEKNDPELIKKVMEVNSFGPMNLCHFVVPFMKKQKSGTILNINSTAGLHPKALNSVYHASKWALTGFTQSLQLELVEFGIKVTDIDPGVMNTKFTAGTNTDLCKSIDIHEVIRAIEFVLSYDKDTYIPEIVIKHI